MISVIVKGDPAYVASQINAFILAGKTILSIKKTKNNSEYLVIRTP